MQPKKQPRISVSEHIPASRGERRRLPLPRPDSAWSAGIALALALAAGPVDLAAVPGLPDPPGARESRGVEPLPANQFMAAYNSMEMADWLKGKGMPAEAAQMYTEALDLFEKLAAAHPQWQPAVVSFRMAYCRKALERLPERAAEEERPPLPPFNSMLQQAESFERAGDFDGALALYSMRLEEFPREAGALKGAGRCCLRLGKMDRARALTRQALALPSPDAETYLLAALVACWDGNYPAAVKLLRQSLKLKAANPEAHTALGAALAAGGRLQEAREALKRALSTNPKFSAAYYNLARLSLQEKPPDSDAARVHYRNALRHGGAPDAELDRLLAE